MNFAMSHVSVFRVLLLLIGLVDQEIKTICIGIAADYGQKLLLDEASPIPGPWLRSHPKLPAYWANRFCL